MNDDTLSSIIRGMLAEGVEPDVIADKVMEDPALRDLLRPIIAWQAKHMLRAQTRAVEQTIRPDAIGGMAARRLLVGRYFPLGDGTFVEWATATAVQHLARATWQRQHAAASMADAERHEVAAKRITEAGVACLADLDETDA